MLFIKKNFICKEKSRTVTRVKLVTKIKKNKQLYFGTLVLGSCCYCGDNASNTDFFQTLASRTAAIWRLKKSQSNANFS